MARWISISVSVSTLEVASSRTRIRGSKRKSPRKGNQLLLADGERGAPFLHLLHHTARAVLR